MFLYIECTVNYVPIFIEFKLNDVFMFDKKERQICSH
jgi:hypothetical protein